MEFNKRDFDNFRKDLQEATEALQEKYKIKINAGKIKYAFNDFTIVLDCVKNENGVDAEKVKFESMCAMYGFIPEDYKKIITINDEKFEFIGFNPTKPKNNCKIISLKTNKVYQTNDVSIKNYILLETAQNRKDRKFI